VLTFTQFVTEDHHEHVAHEQGEKNFKALALAVCGVGAIATIIVPDGIVLKCGDRFV